MACRRHAIFESSSSSCSGSDPDISSASSRKTFPIFPAEKFAPNTVSLKARNCNKSSGNDNDSKAESSKCPRSQKQDNEEPRGHDKDLDEAIALQTGALSLHPVGHTDRSVSLNNLANWLSSCFDHRGNDEDLNQAIALHREALVLCPIGHTDQSMSLNHLATQLSTHFEHRDHNTPDEVIHLAAGLQFARVKNAVGTSSKINDSTVEHSVEAFCKNFCGDGKMNSRRTARALHQAVQSLACDQRSVCVY